MVTGLLVLTRCAGFVFRAPGFSHPAVPPPFRAGFALLMASLVAPGLHAPKMSPGGVAFVAALVAEFLFGSALGLTASLAYDAAYAGGRIVDDYVGVKAIAPSVILVAPSGFGRVWSLAFTGAFFLTGAYRPTVLGFAESFVRVPIESPLRSGGWQVFAGGFITNFVAVALEVAAPAVALAFVTQIAVGSLSRAVPRFGSLTLAFPLAFAAALVATAIAAPLDADRAPAPAYGMVEGVK